MLYDTLVSVMTAVGLPEDSSAELAFHISLHYPEHGAALLGALSEPTPE